MSAGGASKRVRSTTKARLLAERSRREAEAQRRREARRALLACFPAGLAWHVAITAPAAEEGVEAELQRLGFAAWCPMETADAGHRARRHSVERPLFPRYVLFARRGAGSTDLHGVKGLLAILSTSQGIWLSLRAGEVDRLIRAAAAGLFDRTAQARLKTLRKGDSVLITGGPLAGFNAEVLSVSSSKRVKVLLNLFGAHSRATLAFDNLERCA